MLLRTKTRRAETLVRHSTRGAGVFPNWIVGHLSVLLVMSGCGAETQKGAEVCAEPELAILCKIQPEQAAADAMRALGQGDKRLLGVVGYGLSFAGTKLDVATIEQNFGYRVLVVTGDVFVNDEHLKLSGRAVEYARLYNTTIILSAQ